MAPVSVNDGPLLRVGETLEVAVTGGCARQPFDGVVCGVAV